jgi:hypothetical protein
MRIPYDPDPYPDEPIELTYEEFLGGMHRLQKIGFPMERTPGRRGITSEAGASITNRSLTRLQTPWSLLRARGLVPAPGYRTYRSSRSVQRTAAPTTNERTSRRPSASAGTSNRVLS